MRPLLISRFRITSIKCNSSTCSKSSSISLCSNCSSKCTELLLLPQGGRPGDSLDNLDRALLLLQVVMALLPPERLLFSSVLRLMRHMEERLLGALRNQRPFRFQH